MAWDFQIALKSATQNFKFKFEFSKYRFEMVENKFIPFRAWVWWESTITRIHNIFSQSKIDLSHLFNLGEKKTLLFKFCTDISSLVIAWINELDFSFGNPAVTKLTFQLHFSKRRSLEGFLYTHAGVLVQFIWFSNRWPRLLFVENTLEFTNAFN